MINRCDSAAIVLTTRELFPDPDTPVNTVNRRFGISTVTSLRLFSRAPETRIKSCPAAARIGTRYPLAALLITMETRIIGRARRNQFFRWWSDHKGPRPGGP